MNRPKPGNTVAAIEESRMEQAQSPSAELGAVLLAALKALADAGEAEQACRLAGRACVAVRHEDSGQWRRFNALLHRLAPRTGPVGVSRKIPREAVT
jgi:hypothetical protein